jgi:hypothetical protein
MVNEVLTVAKIVQWELWDGVEPTWFVEPGPFALVRENAVKLEQAISRDALAVCAGRTSAGVFSPPGP